LQKTLAGFAHAAAGGAAFACLAEQTFTLFAFLQSIRRFVYS
jgi:hypothetical protein